MCFPVRGWTGRIAGSSRLHRVPMARASAHGTNTTHEHRRPAGIGMVAPAQEPGLDLRRRQPAELMRYVGPAIEDAQLNVAVLRAEYPVRSAMHDGIPGPLE